MKQLIMKNQLINTEMLLENYLNFEENLPRKLGYLNCKFFFLDPTSTPSLSNESKNIYPTLNPQLHFINNIYKICEYS